MISKGMGAPGKWSRDDKRAMIMIAGLVVFFVLLTMQQVYAPGAVTKWLNDTLRDGQPWEDVDTVKLLLALIIVQLGAISRKMR